MSTFCFEDARSPWEMTLDMLRPGDQLSAVRLLADLEGEEEAEVEAALQALEDSHVALDVRPLPRDFGSGELEKRLRLEAQLAGSAALTEALEQGDPLRLYLEELAATPAAGDPQLLAERYLRGDEAAQAPLVNVTISLAVEAARGMTGYGVLLLDLIQEASLGLWQSILHYIGGDFMEHARWWIRQYLARAVTLQARENGVGRKMREGLEAYRAADRALLTRLGRNPTLEELALELEISPEETQTYHDMLRLASTMARVSQPQTDKEPQEDDQAVENTAYFQSRQRITELLSVLSEQEQQVLRLRFGLEGDLPATPQQVGARLGITPETVVQLETAALEKLRKEG